jgi:hypothetical protein
MAVILQAVNQYGPKLELKPTAQLDKLAEWMAMRTGVNKSEVMSIFQESSEAILWFCKSGQPVKIPGVGTFTPSMNRDGEFLINFRADVELKNGINTPSAYDGVIENKDRIGWTNEQYKAAWDADHPTDPLIITPEPS